MGRLDPDVDVDFGCDFRLEVLSHPAEVLRHAAEVLRHAAEVLRRDAKVAKKKTR